MSIYSAETRIAVPDDRVWEALTCGEFSAWPKFLDVTSSDGILQEGTEVITRVDLPFAKGIVVSEVVTCIINSQLETRLVRSEGLPVKTEAANTIIDVTYDPDSQFTRVGVELCLEFSGWKAPVIRRVLEPLIQLHLQPNINQAAAQLEAHYSQLGSE